MYTKFPTHILRYDGAVIPFDEANVDYAAYLAWCATGNVPSTPQPPQLEQRIALLQGVVDDHLNAAARTRRYDSIHTAALRAGYPGPFHDEGMAFAIWMDAVNATCYAVLAQFMAGQIAEPDAQQLLAMLPALTLPESKGA